LGCDQLVI